MRVLVKKRSRINPGNPYLKRTLVQAAHAASRTKNTYLKARYKRIALRRGNKKAIVAVAHKILLSVYPILKLKRPYLDLGDNYFDQQNKRSIIKYHLRRLHQLGLHLSVENTPPALAVQNDSAF